MLKFFQKKGFSAKIRGKTRGKKGPVAKNPLIRGMLLNLGAMWQLWIIVDLYTVTVTVTVTVWY